MRRRLPTPPPGYQDRRDWDDCAQEGPACEGCYAVMLCILACTLAILTIWAVLKNTNQPIEPHQPLIINDEDHR